MLKVVELFAGIGSPRKALKNLNIDHKVIAFSEIDKYAIESYRAIHDDFSTPNLGDITKIEELPKCDLLTYGFPCQDLSIAGYGKGIKQGTRSGLLLEVERLIDIAGEKGNLPKYLILENVKALVQKKHRKDFDIWLEKLESLGYSNYWQVLNAKDYGIPQNRERVFVVSILGEHKPYEFPEKKELKLRLRDLIDNEVPEKYYLKDEKVEIFLEKTKAEKIQGKIAIKTNTKTGYTYAENFDCIDLEYPKSKFRRGRIQQQISNTLKTGGNSGLILLGSLTDKNSQGERVYTTDVAVTQNATGGGMGAKTSLYLVGNVNPCGHGHGGEVYSDAGLSPTITTGKGEGLKIICYDVETSKKVRRHFLDAKKLRDLLVSSKKISNKEIAEKLNKNISTVEHWFRKDESWSIPDEKIWFKLKDLLDIKTSEFDRVLTEFDTLPSKFEKNNRFYDPKGLAPTITTGESIKILNIRDLSTGGQKARVIGTEGISTCLTATDYKDPPKILTECSLRIRRLTPVECFRLMGFTDIDFYRAKEKLNETFYKGRDNSDSQLYKQAGNSIVVNVLEAIFRNLFLEEEVCEYKLF